jgi:CheY-like chemotaxis protein
MRSRIINCCRLATLACSFALLPTDAPGQPPPDTNTQAAANLPAPETTLTHSPAGSGTTAAPVIPLPTDALAKSEATPDHTNSIVVKVLTEQNELVLKYEEFLRQETKEHHDLIQTSYKIAAGLVGLVVAILGIFGFRTIRDLKANAVAWVQESVKNRMSEAIDSSIANQSRRIDETHRASRLKIYKELRSAFGSLFEANESLIDKKLPAGMSKSALEEKRIIWVDDDPVGIACQVALLEALKALVTVRQTTEEAIQELDRDGYHLVISNMNRSPNSTAGVDLAKKIRTKSAVPILIFTKDIHIKNHGQQARDAGANELESKTENLIATIYSLITKPPCDIIT